MKNIKKIYAVIFTVLVSLISFGIVNAAQAEAASLSNTDFVAEQGENFSTIVYMEADSEIVDFQTDITYDTDKVTLISAEPIAGLVGNIEIGTDVPGIISVNYTRISSNMTNETRLFTLTFSVNENLNDGTHDFLGSNEDKTEAHSIKSYALEDVELTDNFKKLVIYGNGDVNLDNKVSIADATYIRQYLVNMRNLSEIQKSKADTVGTDGQVTIADATRIQQKLIYDELILGGRANITFLVDGEIYAVKSVKIGNELKNVPNVPHKEGYDDGAWNVTDFSDITQSITVSAVYGYTGQTDAGKATYSKVLEALNTGFVQSGKYIADNFQLPYKNTYGTFNMLSSSEFDDVDILWSIDSGLLAQSVVIGNDYVVTVPNLDYTTSVTFTAYVYIDGVMYGKQSFDREIKGKIDLPNSNTFKDIIDNIPEDIQENYRLPGSVSLESDRMNYGVKIVQNVDIKWSLVEGEAKGFNSEKNQLLYLKNENPVTLKADFIFDGYSVYSQTITRTIPAKSLQGQAEYAEQYLSEYVPSLLSGDALFPYQIDLYDLTVTWRSGSASGKFTFGSNTTYKDHWYTPIGVGSRAGYLEWGTLIARVERNGDSKFNPVEIEYPIQLAGDSTEINHEKIPDMNLYKALLKTFDTKYGNDDGILTEEEIYDLDVAEKLDYTIDLSNLDIENLAGVDYLVRYRSLNLAGNKLGGSDAHIARLSGLTNLEQIDLSRCNISEIPKSVFSSMYAIEGIDLSYNNLKDLSFLAQQRKFTELTDLLVQGNDISDISALSYVNGSGETVSTIPNVKRLTLSRKLDSENTETMNIEPLQYANKLNVLWLANNGIEDISPLVNCTLLTTLDLSNNKISAPNANDDGLLPLSKMRSLVCLMLNDNEITTVRSLRRLTNLQELSLSNNTIGSADALSSLTNLTYLDLDENNLTAFNAGTFTRLNFLYLEDNNIEQLVSIGDCKDLYQLRLSYNNLSNPDTYDEISSLENLYYLTLSGNNVGSLSFLENLTGLRQLELDNCAIYQYYEVVTEKENVKGEIEKTTEIKDNLDALSNLTSLGILDISQNNAISDITALGRLTNLQALYMDGIHLEHWDPLSRMTGLKYLSMQNSEVTDIDFIPSLTGLVYLNLSGHATPEINFNNFRYCENIEQLFMDSSVESEGYNMATGLVNAVNLARLSVRNINIGSMDVIPDLESLEYLNLQNTGITDFKGSETKYDGYIYSLDPDRFPSLRAVTIRENDELFTKKNLNFLYDQFNGKEIDVYLYTAEDMPYDAFYHVTYEDTDDDGNIHRNSYMAYRDEDEGIPENAKLYEDYIWGTFDRDIEIEMIKPYIDFGKVTTDISSAIVRNGDNIALKGYQLPTDASGFSIDWDMEDIYGCYVDNNKLYFNRDLNQETDLIINLVATVHDLYGQDYDIPYAVHIVYGTDDFTMTIEADKAEDTDLTGWTQEKFTPALYSSEYTEWSSIKQDVPDDAPDDYEQSRLLYRYYYVKCDACGNRMGIYGHSSNDSRVKLFQCFHCGHQTRLSAFNIVEEWMPMAYDSDDVHLNVLNANAEYIINEDGGVWFVDRHNELTGTNESIQYRYLTLKSPASYTYTRHVEDGLVLKVDENTTDSADDTEPSADDIVPD